MVELIAKRYGTAIYQLAVEKDQIDIVANEIASIKTVLETEEDFVKILNHPKIVVEEKIALVESIFKGKVSDDVMGLIVLTIVKGRQSHLVDIIKYCEDAIDEHNNIVSAFVTSTEKLDKPHKKQLNQRLETLTGKSVNMSYDVDKSLIGGMIIRIGDRILDSSIKGKLANMSKALYEA
jgi:F-type H+-transporting ATPase subunit delta